jgi:hypothetical protein
LRNIQNCAMEYLFDDSLLDLKCELSSGEEREETLEESRGKDKKITENVTSHKDTRVNSLEENECAAALSPSHSISIAIDDFDDDGEDEYLFTDDDVSDAEIDSILLTLSVSQGREKSKEGGERMCDSEGETLEEEDDVDDVFDGDDEIDEMDSAWMNSVSCDESTHLPLPHLFPPSPSRPSSPSSTIPSLAPFKEKPVVSLGTVKKEISNTDVVISGLEYAPNKSEVKVFYFHSTFTRFYVVLNFQYLESPLKRFP